MAFLAHALRLKLQLKIMIIIPEEEVLNVKEKVSFTLRCKAGGNTAETTPVCPPEALGF